MLIYIINVYTLYTSRDTSCVPVDLMCAVDSIRHVLKLQTYNISADCAHLCSAAAWVTKREKFIDNIDDLPLSNANRNNSVANVCGPS